jgi:hypothetical protein
MRHYQAKVSLMMLFYIFPFIFWYHVSSLTDFETFRDCKIPDATTAGTAASRTWRSLDCSKAF